jgi:hypothetical protein
MLEELIDAGRKLSESNRPPIGDVGSLLAGLVYLVEHGNLDVPEPSPEETQASPEAQRVETLEAELAAAKAREAPVAVAAAPGVLPEPEAPAAPVAPVPPVEPVPPVAAVPDAPAAPEAPAAPVDPPAAAPVAPPVQG